MASCCPHRHSKVLHGTSTHPTKNKPAANAFPEADPEPQPSDGPDYHMDHAFWVERQEKRGQL